MAAAPEASDAVGILAPYSRMMYATSADFGRVVGAMGAVDAALAPHTVGHAVRMEYVSRAPRPPLEGLVHDIYYLAGSPPYARLTLPAAPAPLLIVNLGAPFHIRAGTEIEATEYADGCVVSTPTRAWHFGYPSPSRSVGVHLMPWGLAPFLPMTAAELCDKPAAIEQVWGRAATTALHDQLAAADEPT